MLVAALNDEEPLIRGHEAWALAQVAAKSDWPSDIVAEIGAGLLRRLFVEEDEWVREEIVLALSS